MTDDTSRTTNTGRITDDTRREGEWTGDQWAGENEADDDQTNVVPDTAETAATTDRWNKTQWVGDQGEGAPAPVDPDEMAEGEQGLSGHRDTSGEQHWAGDRSEPVTGDRPLERE